VTLARLSANRYVDLPVNGGFEYHETGPAKTLPVKFVAFCFDLKWGY